MPTPTVRDILGRVAHDVAFARGATFEAGYFDRVARRVVFVPLAPESLPTPLCGTLQLLAPDGTLATIPLHRLRVIRRNGQMVWSRPGPALRTLFMLLLPF